MIVTWPDKRLATWCDPIEDQELAVEIEDSLFEGMSTYRGVGLAAPQIGHTVRMFVIRGYPHAFCNPVIEYGDKWVWKDEGCLSLPGIRVPKERAKKVRVQFSYARDLTRRISLKLHGMDARIAQHEFDHLNGVMIVSDMGKGA